MLDTAEIETLFAQPEALAALPSTSAGYGNSCRASHGLRSIVGYVVRLTVENGVVIRSDNARCGRDVGAVLGDENFSQALALRDRAVRDKTGAYAVIDNVYACGCRS